jgi:hypothetical protein
MLNVRLALTEAALFTGCASQPGKARNTRSLTLAAVLLCSMTPAKAEYKLHVGDVIEINWTELFRSRCWGRCRSRTCRRRRCKPRRRPCSRRRSFGSERRTVTRIR